MDITHTQKVVCTVDKVKQLVPDTCKICGGPVSLSKCMSGAVLVLQWNCSNEHSDSWTSSEVLVLKKQPESLCEQCATGSCYLLSGNNLIKFDLLAKFLGLRSVSKSLYFRVQKLYCCPAVKNMWGQVKKAVHEHLPSTGVTIARYRRRDAPGYTAWFCVYALMEEFTKMIVDLEVVDKRETEGKSVAMEKLALSRLLTRLKDVLTISHLVTDASTSIKALVSDLKGTLCFG